MKKALVIGLNDYGCNRLDWCDNDAIAVKELLETNGDGSPDFDTRLIVGTCNYKALKESVEELFSGDSEIAMLYFSGHGAHQDDGYLCTTDLSENCLGVRMSDILRFAEESKCKNKVIILDCCFAAKMGEAILAGSRSILGEGVTIIAASQSWQTAEEQSEIEHGLFTSLLLQGLRGGAADIRGNITPASLYAYVDQSLCAWQQRPVFKTNISQFLPLRTVQSKVTDAQLRKLSVYFENPTDEYSLDPSYEFTNSPDVDHAIKKPFADEKNVEIMKELQLYESVGLVEPVDTDHMYFAAMENKSCRLTAMGLHYWKLSKDKRF